MDHSTAIMEEAGKAIDNAAAPPAADQPAPPPAQSTGAGAEQPAGGDSEQAANGGDNQQRKRKGNFPDSSLRHGSRKGGRQSDGDNKRHKKGDMGRADYL